MIGYLRSSPHFLLPGDHVVSALEQDIETL
jgi:hypothetical protein